MVQFFLKRSDSGSSFSSADETQFISCNIYQSRYPPTTEHKPPWTWPSLIPLQIPIGMREALWLITHCLKNSSLIWFVFGIDNSGDSLNQCLFCGKFSHYGHKRNQCKIYKLGCFGGKIKAKVTIFGGKNSHMEPFRQMSYCWSPELGRTLKRFYFTV
jgi:hypothetical protein